MQTLSRWGLGLGLFLSGTASAQLNLANLYTQTVKANQPWASIETTIKNLSVQVEINRGIVTTQATFEYTPSQGRTENYQCTSDSKPCPENDTLTCWEQTCTRSNRDDLDMDSLETAASFNLELNSVITDMYLWVGDTRVKAALQERALASAQYESIVQRRRDPALLETWGNGSYYLRVFPNESGQTRKLQIEFVQGMENQGRLVQTVLPIIHSIVKALDTSTTTVTAYENLPNRSIAQVQVEIVAVDGKTYDLDWPGLGSGKVGSTPLKFSAKGMEEIKPGMISVSASSCASCLTPWTAEKGTQSYFGVKPLLQAKNLEFGDEPRERHFIVDVHGFSNDAQAVDRARKIALLSMKAYAGEPYVANLGFSNGMGGVTYVFPKPVSMGASQLQTAYEALRDWTAPKNSQAETTLRQFAGGRGPGAEPCLVYLINNDTAAYFNWGSVYNETTQAEYQKWENAQLQKDSALAQTLTEAKVMLFGFWDNYRLGTVAHLTGGFQGGAVTSYYYGYWDATMDMVARPIDPIQNLQMPPLFGPDRPNAYQLAKIQVEAKGLNVHNLVIIQSQEYASYALRNDMMVAKRALAKKTVSSASLAAAGLNDSLSLRISGQYQGSGKVTLRITGLWGGLTFAADYEVELPSTAGGQALGAGIWAGQKSEVLGNDYAHDHTEALQQLGKDYHIVNRQMSLLALEPGMELWTEMPSRENSTSGTQDGAEVSLSSDMRAAPGSTLNGSLDQVSLEEILLDFVPINPGNRLRPGMAGALVSRALGDEIELSWTLPPTIHSATFQIVSLSGRNLASLKGNRQAKGSAGSNGFTASWKAPDQKGIYVIIARAGKFTRMQTLWVGGSNR